MAWDGGTVERCVGDWGGTGEGAGVLAKRGGARRLLRPAAQRAAPRERALSGAKRWRA